MGKRKLTREMVEFIIEKKEQANNCYSLDEIAELLNEQFNVSVSPCSVGRAYRLREIYLGEIEGIKVKDYIELKKDIAQKAKEQIQSKLSTSKSKKGKKNERKT